MTCHSVAINIKSYNQTPKRPLDLEIYTYRKQNVLVTNQKEKSRYEKQDGQPVPFISLLSFILHSTFAIPLIHLFSPPLFYPPQQQQHSVG